MLSMMDSYLAWELHLNSATFLKEPSTPKLFKKKQWNLCKLERVSKNLQQHPGEA